MLKTTDVTDSYRNCRDLPPKKKKKNPPIFATWRSLGRLVGDRCIHPERQRPHFDFEQISTPPAFITFKIGKHHFQLRKKNPIFDGMKRKSTFSNFETFAFYEVWSVISESKLTKIGFCQKKYSQSRQSVVLVIFREVLTIRPTQKKRT
jgi:hypothetical protein